MTFENANTVPTSASDDNNEADVVVVGLQALSKGNLPDKAFTDKFGTVLGVRNRDGGTEIILGDNIDFTADEDDEYDEDVDVFEGLKAIKNGKAPSQKFLDHTGLTPEQVASFALVSNNGEVQPALQDLLDFATSQGGTINLSSMGGIGGTQNPDLSVGLSAASTPDKDNPNHEWRDGKKYARGTSIEVMGKTAPVRPATFIESAWGK